MSTATPEPQTKQRTSFHIFREVTENGAVGYQPVEANVQASSAAAAIRATVKVAGRYVAIPSRSFQPVTVKIETQTVVKVG